MSTAVDLSAPVKITLPDGSVKEVAGNSTALNLAESISSRLAQDVIAVVVNDTICDVSRPLGELDPNREGISIRLLTVKDQEALGVMRHSCAHIMARAVMRLFPGTGLAFGPTTGHGFYYDFDLDQTISEEDFPKIEQEMAAIINQEEPFERFMLTSEKAVQLCQEMDQELKTEHVQTGLADHEELSFYRHGEFVDLCRGPHIPNSRKIKAFKLLSVAGAYWKGDKDGRQLQRVYGTAWFSPKDLNRYLEQVEEAKRRDHRVLGKKLGLFTIDPTAGSGLCLWLPKGAVIRSQLEEFIKKELLKLNYQIIYSPQIGRVEMYETSGHFPYYRDSQFAPIYGHDAGRLIDFCIQKLDQDDLSADEEAALIQAAEIMGFEKGGYKPSLPKKEKIEALQKWERQQERYLLRPMNCPHHVMMYKSQPRSYRDLPVKFAEFGNVYRYEQTGELNGLLRVRGFTQDDAHLFCTPEQVEQEFRETIGLVQKVLKAVGLDDYRVQLSLRDPKSDKYVGSEEHWQQAEISLRNVLNEMGLTFETCEGEAAFYGPKADFMVRDAIGREWQLGTVQLDYSMPERFGLEYTGADNAKHCPVMIHRAPFGSMERFVGMLIEHFAGAFPLWLAPEQVRVLPIIDEANDYAQEVLQQLRASGFRADIDLRSTKINGKVRDAQLELIPYMFVVGKKEAAQGTVSIRDRIESKTIGVKPLAEAIAQLQEEVSSLRIRQAVKSSFGGFEEGGAGGNEY